jgi:hypothetical protein
METKRTFVCILTGLGICLVVALPAAAAGKAPFTVASVSPSTTPPAPIGLPAQGGGSLGSLTVEGASQVRIHFERPQLKLDLDPMAAPGLETESTLAIVERKRPDLMLPLLEDSALERAVRTPHPWVTGFAVGTLARLRQDVKGIAGWQLEIIDARGTVARRQAGEGTPPGEITWDGLGDDGSPAPCGLAYAPVLTARDKAGNTRRFVGASFSLPAYRVEAATGPCLLFSAEQWRADGGRGVSPLLVEAATVLNLHTDPDRPLVVTASAPTADEAESIGREVIEALAPLVGGGDKRLELDARVVPGAPAGGTVQVAPRVST